MRSGLRERREGEGDEEWMEGRTENIQATRSSTAFIQFIVRNINMNRASK